MLAVWLLRPHLHHLGLGGTTITKKSSVSKNMFFNVRMAGLEQFEQPKKSTNCRSFFFLVIIVFGPTIIRFQAFPNSAAGRAGNHVQSLNRYPWPRMPPAAQCWARPFQSPKKANNCMQLQHDKVFTNCILDKSNTVTLQL